MKHFMVLTHDEVQNNIRSGPNSDNYSSWAWTNVRPLGDDKDTEFAKRDSALSRLHYSNRNMYSLLNYHYLFGVDFNPDYQRGSVWDEEDREKLLDSIFAGREIGYFVFKRLPFTETSKDGSYYEIVDGKQRMSKVIAPMDNTGYRGYTGESVNIFYTVEDCVKCYREQVRQAKSTYKKELARITSLFSKRIEELDESLSPYDEYKTSKNTVTVKIRVWSKTYQTKEILFSKEMYPTDEEIEVFKKQALSCLPEKLRQETDWKTNGLVVTSADIYVIVDGLMDKSAKEKVELDITL